MISILLKFLTGFLNKKNLLQLIRIIVTLFVNTNLTNKICELR